MLETIQISFETISLVDLAALDAPDLDDLPFGVIGLDRDGVARIYNTTEARMAGLKPSSVLGTAFFESVAQCMNNFLVAQRFDDEAELDDIVPFVLTLRMRPTPVRLRLLASKAHDRRFVLIAR